MDNALPVHRLDGCTVVELPETIDLDNAPGIETHLLALLDARAAGLVVDMSGTSFCDSTGINAVVQAYQRAQESGTWVRLVITEPAVTKVFRITAVDQLITIHASVEDAVAETPN